jgi:hypothetical protein
MLSVPGFYQVQRPGIGDNIALDMFIGTAPSSSSYAIVLCPPNVFPVDKSSESLLRSLLRFLFVEFRPWDAHFLYPRFEMKFVKL